MPYVRVHISSNVLDDFDDEDLIEHLESCGYIVTKKVRQEDAQKSIEIKSLDHVEHLITIGLYRAARDEAVLIVERQLGRPGTISAVH